MATYSRFLVRSRSCLWYIPYIATFFVGIGAAATAIWIVFTKRAYHDTKDGLDMLDVTLSSNRLAIFMPVLIATSSAYLGLAFAILVLSVFRSLVEARHDRTGEHNVGSMLYLILNVLVAIPWWVCIGWVVLVAMGDSVWAALLYIIRSSIQQITDQFGTSGVTAVYIPGQPCPRSCLDLTMYKFLDSNLENACICDLHKLEGARSSFDDAYGIIAAVLVGAWVMWIAGVFLIVNFACQFAHTNREREHTARLSKIQEPGFSAGKADFGNQFNNDRHKAYIAEGTERPQQQQQAPGAPSQEEGTSKWTMSQWRSWAHRNRGPQGNAVAAAATTSNV